MGFDNKVVIENLTKKQQDLWDDIDSYYHEEVKKLIEIERSKTQAEVERAAPQGGVGKFMQIAARVLLDSISEYGHRLTTLEVVMPRIILAEFNTHRVFSRNSASSRAIPFKTTGIKIESDPFVPVKWTKNKPGMQGGDEFRKEDARWMKDIWRQASEEMLHRAEQLDKIGVHKSIVNRLLEPFMWHTVIVSSTEWDNFLNQRDSPLAETHMEMVAKAMREVLDNSIPIPMDYGYWHTPLILKEEYEYLASEPGLATKWRKQVSAARCARVSYLTHEGIRDQLEDLKLFSRLMKANPPHWSPLEHVATPALESDIVIGNFTGWHQMRHYSDNNNG